MGRSSGSVQWHDRGDVFGGAAHGDLVHVDDLAHSGWPRRASAFSILRSSSTSSCGLLDGGGLALDVRQDRIDLRSFAQDLGFQAADKVVRLKQRHVFVEFHVLLHVQLARGGIAR